MAQLDSEQLKKAFHQEMIALYKRMTKELKYKSPRLMDLINKYGGYEAAVKYITTENNVQDFAVLWENERLDLSVEALITNNRYRDLFMEDIVKYCDRKLQEYSYAPNKIEEVEEEPISFYEETPLFTANKEFIGFPNDQKEQVEEVVAASYELYSEGIAITKAMWEDVLQNSQLVSQKNLDLLLRIYLIGDAVTPEELSKEEGYLVTYPYNEVVTALAKRIKAYLKIDAPTSSDNKPLWWHILFLGGVKDNSCFEWSLRKNLREAIKTLIQEEKIQIDHITVHTQKEVLALDEKPLKEPEKEEAEKEDDLSDFDRLFEAIMMPKVKSEPVVVKESPKEHIPVKEVSTIQEVTKKVEPVVQKVEQRAETIQQSEIVQEETKVKEESKQLTKEQIKAECIDYYGAICDICGFDYGYTYGEAYEMAIEVHNTKEESVEEILPHTHPIEDLVPICHNCHHILHTHRPALTIEQMRQMIKA